MPLLGEVKEPVGGKLLLERVCRWGWALRIYTLTPLPALSPASCMWTETCLTSFLLLPPCLRPSPAFPTTHEDSMPLETQTEIKPSSVSCSYSWCLTAATEKWLMHVTFSSYLWPWWSRHSLVFRLLVYLTRLAETCSEMSLLFYLHYEILNCLLPCIQWHSLKGVWLARTLWNPVWFPMPQNFILFFPYN